MSSQKLTVKCPIQRAVFAIMAGQKESPLTINAGGKSVNQQTINYQIAQHDHHEWVRDGNIYSAEWEVVNSVDDNIAVYCCRFCLVRATEAEFLDAIVAEVGKKNAPSLKA